MIRRYRYDKDLECLIEMGGNSNYFEEKPQGPNVIKDDIGAGVNGLRHMASGRRFDSKYKFRQHTKDRGLVEVGNDRMASDKPKTQDYGHLVKQAWEQFDHNYNGTADIVRQQEQRARWRRENG